MSVDRVFEEELLEGDAAETVGALLHEDPRELGEIASVVGLRPMQVEAVTQAGGEPLGLRRLAQVAAALGYRIQIVPVKIGEPGPDWTRSIAAMAATDAALGVDPAASKGERLDRSDALKERIEQAQKGVVADAG